MKLLHLDSSIKYRDLAADPLPHLSFAPEAGAAHAASLEDFLEADIVVIGAPMYNFAIPSQLKAWIDSIAVAGKTFRYTENGPQGLVSSKRVIIASSRGGAYSDGPATAMDHQENYLRHVFGFIGISDVEFVRAEGVGRADTKATAIERALAHADTFAAPEAVAA